MNPFILSADQRLADWAAFRRSISTLSDNERLDKTAAYFARAPLTKRAYDPEASSDWPTPWEMMHRGEWDRDITAVGIEATLRLSGIEPNRIELRYIDVPSDSVLQMVVLVDRIHALNYAWGAVVPMPSPHHTRCRWRYAGRGYVEF